MPVNDALTPKLKALARLLDRLPEIAGTEAVNFFKERFEKQGWQDGSFTPWARKKAANGYPALRSGNTNGLVDTIHWERAGEHSVIVRAGGSQKPYARIHNEGGVINVPVTDKSRKWAWAMYARTKDSKYKAFALQKKSVMQITIPKRQYLGASANLVQNIQEVIYNNIKRIMK
ncbi:MAG: phage virion morphogenesis protein [Bacteroidetes bacterium]|nr:phage virion morphogenesis protein [Bacteroidota bacterium]